MKLKITILSLCLLFMAGAVQAQTQTGYRVPTRLDIGGGRMTGDMWCQYGTNGVRFKIGTQAVTQVGTTGVVNGTNATSLPSLDFTYGGGSMSANFNSFNAVYIAGSQVGTSGALTSKLDAVGGVGTNNTFNNPTLAGLGTITASFGANGLVISPEEYSAVNNATGELQAQINGKQASLVNNSPGTITNVLGYTPPANTPGSITTSLGYTPIANVPGSITSALGYTPPANTPGSITSALGYTPTDLGNNIELGTETTGNTNNIAEGSTNKYYQDTRVNAAVGSLSVNTLSNVDIVFNENDFVKIVGGQLVAGSSSATVAFSEVTGSATSAQLPANPVISGDLFASGIVGGTTTGALKIPSGTTAQRPTAEDGMLRVLNSITGIGTNTAAQATGGVITTTNTGTQTTYLEWYTGANWNTYATGTAFSIGSWTVHTFTSSGNFVVNSGTLTVEVLVVGSGAGGASDDDNTGGGGAGGMLSATNAVSGTITVTVGAGGAGGIYSAGGNYGTDGNSSSFGTITVAGGGKGAPYTSAGGTGACGGGAGQNGSPGGTGTVGYSGGAGSANSGGGGGGMGGLGGNAVTTTGGDGGIGLQNNITGTNVYYSGGGRGKGSSVDGTAGTGTVGQGGDANIGTNGEDGNNGIVIVRYLN